MLDNKKIKEVENRIKHHISNGIIKSKESKQNVDFFLTNKI